MRIVFIGPFGLQPKGTMRVRAIPMAQALAARGHQVTVLIPPWDDPERAGQHWEEDGVQIINVTLPIRWPFVFHILLTWRLITQALAHKPEVIHCFKPKAYAGLAHLALHWLRWWHGAQWRLVVDADDWEQAWNEIAAYSPFQKYFFAWQEKWGLSRADTITIASRAIEQLIIEQVDRDRSQPTFLFYVPNGYRATPDTPQQQATASEATAVRQQWQLGEAPTILLYSRFLEFRLSRIVTLVQKIALHLPEARWLIIGKGLNKEEELLAQQLAAADLHCKVYFTGWLPMNQLPAYFRAADVAIYPYDDTMINRTKCSVKLIDLLTAALPVVADAVGQNCEYIQTHVSGILVPAEDDSAFSKALLSLLRHPEQRQKLGRTAAHHVQENFNWDRLVETVEKAYQFNDNDSNPTSMAP